VPQKVLDNPLHHHKGLLAAEDRVCEALSGRYRTNRDTGKAHDMKGSGVMHQLSSEVVATCLPSGQVKAFPHNCLSLMTVTGAKGSMVNFSQISALLGQQELEGRRPPRMASGKTLPSFRPFDAGARSNGFVGDRFLSGLRPQEYYFHCMAGREGLVDTAVKTSRSGYLQRCLIKNLETLRIHYDNTVRDNADGSVVQFFYGEDGIDVMGVSYMKQFGFLAKNAARFAQQLDLAHALQVTKVACLSGSEKTVRQLNGERRSLLEAAAGLGGASSTEQAKAQRQLKQQLPVMAVHPPAVLGSVSEAFGDALLKYVQTNPDRVLAPEEEVKHGKQAPKGVVREVEAKTFTRLMHLKFMRSLAAPGEAVGVLAGQSVGEPSTQMTLNTFHMAGRGEANVTLGIPRLREILMTAAAKIKTPVMTLPLKKGLNLSHAQVLANRMRKLRLAECLSGISVQERPVAPSPGGGYGRTYTIVLQFFSPSQYPPEAKLSFDELSTCFKSQFCSRLRSEVEKETKRKVGLGIGKLDISLVGKEGEEGGAGGSGAPEGAEDDNVGGSNRSRAKKSAKADDFEDEEEDETLREAKLGWRGGRGEAATYEGMDEEDAEVAAKAAALAARKALQADDDDDDDLLEQPAEGSKTPVAGGKEDKQAAKAAKGAKSSKAAAAVAAATPPAPGVRLDDGIDAVNHRCEVSLTLPLHAPKLLMLEIVEKVAATTMVRSTPGIDKVYVVEGKGGEGPRVQTDGINFVGAWEHSDLIDVNAITTNDVAAMLTTYGVEAARATIMREVQAVFSAYGIGVDPRHLYLIADFMTHQGGYRAMNRMGIESAVSPFLKMSFETAAHFLTDATLKGSKDDLKSPSARLCVGRVVELGTGVVELVHNMR